MDRSVIDAIEVALRAAANSKDEHAAAYAKRAQTLLAYKLDYIELPKDHIFTADERERRREWALRFIPQIAGVARGMGYGIFHGGSLIRDIDLVAVPWQSPTAKKPDIFALDLCMRMNLQFGNHGYTLFGHRWFALWDRGHRDHQIDLKIILPANDAKLSEED